MNKVIVMSVGNDGGDDGSYDGKLIGVLEGVFEVEHFDEEWMMKKSKELYFGDDEWDENDEFEGMFVEVIDNNYNSYYEFDGVLYGFKLLK